MASELDSAEQAGSEGVAAGAAARRVRRILAVGGGKGGAGKSLIAANIGIFLATLGKRVVLLDADLGGANLHTFVGVERPCVTIGDLFAGKVARVEDCVVETSIPGLGLVSGEGDPSWIANPRPAQKYRLLSEVQQLDVDVLVVDLGPGSGDTAIDFFLMADDGVLVVVPEPTSVENTYRFMKAAFLRRLRRAGVEIVGLVREDGGVPSPLDLYLAARERNDPALIETLGRHMAEFRPSLVVNQVRTRADVELSESVARATWRRLGLAVDDLGHIESDDAVWLAVRKRRPLLVEHATSRVAKGIERVTRRLLGLEQERQDPPPPPVGPTHYEMLEIDPAATDEEIRRAHRRTRERYGHDSLAICGLYDRERLAALHLGIEEAYDTLMDAVRRRAYDRMLFPERPDPPRRVPPGRASGEQPVVLARASSPTVGEGAEAGNVPAPILEDGEEITGALLRKLREARGVDLRTISQKTKIGVAYLRDIEEERFAALPAIVYVRGFLTSYARFLRLPVQRVLDTYLARYREARVHLDGERAE